MTTVKINRYAEFEKYASGRHYFVALSMLLSGISAALSLVPFYYIWLIIKEALDVHPNYDLAVNLVHNGYMALIFSVISVLIYVLALMISHLAAFRIFKNMRKKLVEHTVSLPPGTFDYEGSGRIRRVILDSVSSTHEFVAHNQPDIVGILVLPIAIISLLFVFDWRIGVASLIPVVLGAYASRSTLGKEASRKNMREWQSSMEDVTNHAVEYVRGISVVKVFQQTVDSFHNFKAAINKYGKFCIDFTKLERMPMTKFFTLINGCVVFVIAGAVIVVELLENGVVSNEMIANILFFVTLTPMISVLMMRIMFSTHQLYRVDDALFRVNQILAMKPLEEPASPIEPIEFGISFDNVTFSYSDDAPPAVESLSLQIQQGKITALVGPSGSGKTTVASLAGRFWDPQVGSVRIGNVDVRDIGSDNLHRIISYVFQNNRLIKGTLLDNVRLGKPNATIDEVSKALSLAQCDGVVDKLPNGLETLIGPGGTYLSGGETQRIAIARALLRDTPIVILDEATAFADPENEYLIQKAFEELAKNRTVLLIAHRLTTVRNADLICMMDHGKIIESGNHDELLIAQGKYKRMWDDYQKALTWKVKGVIS